MTNEIESEIEKEQTEGESGDALDELASASEIEIWKTKKGKLSAGLSNIASRASELATGVERR
jgi:X-X-X-Leu-X-X-Gly heptad repeat protein